MSRIRREKILLKARLESLIDCSSKWIWVTESALLYALVRFTPMQLKILRPPQILVGRHFSPLLDGVLE